MFQGLDQGDWLFVRNRTRCRGLGPPSPLLQNAFAVLRGVLVFCGQKESTIHLLHDKASAAPPPPLPQLNMKHGTARVGGTPTGGSSICEQRDNCPILTC